LIVSFALATALKSAALFLFMLLLSEVGRRAGIARAARDPDSMSKGSGPIEAAIFGLLGLLLAFTFSGAASRFEERRHLIVQEANAIGTAYLRAQLVEEPHRARISRLLVDYTDNRLEIATSPPNEARRLVGRNDRLATELWVATAAVFPALDGRPFSSDFIDSMNAVIDLNTSRKAARYARVPYEVYLGLFIYIIAAAGLVGFALDGQREKSTAGFLFVLLTLALMLIIDIDRPAAGGINESQWPMEDLQASLRSWPPALFDAPATRR
jgi:hypothetical protein